MMEKITRRLAEQLVLRAVTQHAQRSRVDDATRPATSVTQWWHAAAKRSAALTELLAGADGFCWAVAGVV
jgi:hypothetical protein